MKYGGLRVWLDNATCFGRGLWWILFLQFFRIDKQKPGIDFFISFFTWKKLLDSSVRFRNDYQPII